MLETRWENVVKLGQPRRTLGQRVLLQGIPSIIYSTFYAYIQYYLRYVAPRQCLDVKNYKWRLNLHLVFSFSYSLWARASASNACRLPVNVYDR